MVGRSSDGRWRVLGYLSLTDNDEFVIYRLEIRPWTSDVIFIGTDVLRNLPLHRWLVEAHSRLTEPIAEWLRDKGVPARAVDDKELRRLSKLAERMAASTPPRTGPKGFGEDFYRRLALDYLALQKDGISRGIRQELARRETKRQGKRITDINIRDALNKATQLGFLSPGTSGRAGRRPGPNLLYSDDKED